MPSQKDIAIMFDYIIKFEKHWSFRGRTVEIVLDCGKTYYTVSDYKKNCKIDDSGYIYFLTIPKWSNEHCQKVRHEQGSCYFTLRYDQEIVDTQKQSKEQKVSLRKRDSQRSKVYRFENRLKSVFGYTSTFLTIDECQELINEIFDIYGFSNPPRMTTSRKNTRYGFASYTRNIIKTHPDYLEYRHILHEIAHFIDYHTYGYSNQHHAPFVSIVLELYEMYLGWDEQKARIIADEMKVKCN